MVEAWIPDDCRVSTATYADAQIVRLHLNHGFLF